MRSLLTDRIVILGIILLSLIKFFDLSGNFVLAEPDVITHLEIVNNFHYRTYPIWQGQGWYFGLPLYLFLGYLVSLVITNASLALTVVSVISSIVLNVAIFLFIRRKINLVAGVLASLGFLISPSAVFYSRVGLIEMTVAAFSFVFLFLFDLGIQERNWRKIFLSGISLGLGILTKYTALIFALIPVIYLFWEALRTLLQRKNLVEQLKFPFLSSLTSLVVGGLIPLPLVIYFLITDGARFKLLTKATLLESPEFWGKAGFHLYLSEYLGMVPLLVGGMGLVLAVIGLSYAFLAKGRKLGLFLISFVISLFFVMKRNPYPRYFMVVIPFFTILTGLGIYALVEFIKKSNFRIWSAIVGLILLGLLIPDFYYAYSSGNHQIVEDTAGVIKAHNPQNLPVFTTYWPNLFAYAGTGEKTTWLTDSPWDVTAFGKGLPQNLNSLQILGKTGGFVIVENLYTKSLWQDMDRVGVVTSDVRRLPAKLIEETKQPLISLIDTRPNFPLFSTSYQNQVKIYEFKPEGAK